MQFCAQVDRPPSMTIAAWAELPVESDGRRRDAAAVSLFDDVEIEALP